ncbi:MAG: ATP-binding cassette domain-containing protein, partial [Thermoleophilaceae bacterium]
LVGPNGSGKTTLIETLVRPLQERGPSPGLAVGKLRRGHNVEIGYLSQHAEELDARNGDGPLSCTVLEAAQRATGLTPNKARALLGQFLFSGEEAEKPLEGLSGGERRRLSLAILVQSGANFLIIDEPTNHLDLESREALEDALRAFDGTVLLVSHDRALLDAVGTRTIAIEEQGLKSYLGGWADYVRVRDERKELAKPPKAAKEKKKPARAKPAGISKDRKRRIGVLEREIEAAERSLRELEHELADPSAWASPTSTERSAKRHEEAKKRIEELYEQLGALEPS